MNIISRLDSYVINFKMPWENRDPNKIVFSVGILEEYNIADMKKSEF